MADPNYPYLSSNIKSLRRVYGEEQLDLANAIGLTIPAVSNYERGERIPKRDIIARIAKHYRITEDELLYSDLSNMKNISNRPFYDPVFVKRKCEQKGPKKVSTFSTRFHVVSNVFPKYQMLTF